jgi:predicted acylesterase/phospholipase RssA
MEKQKTLIVISGGGFAQIESSLGCLRALSHAGYDLGSPYITWRGTSAGGIVATVLALGNHINDVISAARKTKTEDLISKRWFWPVRMLLGGCLYNRSGLENFIKNFVGNDTAENVRVMVTDLETKAKSEMPGNFKSCLATSSIYRIFAAAEIDGRQYIDGGYTDNVPLEPRMLAEYDKIFIILPPRDSESERHKSTLIGRVLQELDTKISQEVNEAESTFSDKKSYPNVTLLRPPPVRTSLLAWSAGFSLIGWAYHYAIEKLKSEKENSIC